MSSALGYAPALNPKASPERTIQDFSWNRHEDMPPESEIERDGRGRWIRKVWKHLGPDAARVTEDGRIEHAMIQVAHGVALTAHEAQLKTSRKDEGLIWDYFDPDWGWFRYGWKPERDHTVIMPVVGGVNVDHDAEVHWAPANDHDQMAWQHDPVRLNALTSVQAASGSEPKRRGRRAAVVDASGGDE